MTVKDLLVYLQTLPQDTEIVCTYRQFSEHYILEHDDLDFKSADEGIAEVYGSSVAKYVKRNGQIMRYDAKTWDANEVPHFVNILAFPGN